MLNANRDLEWKEVNLKKDNVNKFFECSFSFSVSLTKEETKDLNIDQLINYLNLHAFCKIYEDIPEKLLEYLNSGLTDLNQYYSIYFNAKKEDLKSHSEIVKELKAFCSLIPSILKKAFNK